MRGQGYNEASRGGYGNDGTGFSQNGHGYPPKRGTSEGGGRKKALSKSRRRKFQINTAVGIMMIVFMLILGICAIVYFTRDNQPKSPTRTKPIEPIETVAVGNTDVKQPKSREGFTSVAVQNTKVHEGDLILVNYEHEYTFPEDNDISSIYDSKSKSYKVNSTQTMLSKAVILKFNKLVDDFYENTGCKDILVVSGYRSFEDQSDIYRQRVETQGAEMAAKYVADPGKSEHHTGLAMDLSVYLSDGSSYYLAEYEPCNWFEEHATEYGFVLRYPDEKYEITKINYESWHYRYVGVPHSLIMEKTGLCFEEYIEQIRSLGDSKYLIYKEGQPVKEAVELDETADAVIYFVPQTEGDETQIPVPEGWEYQISGDNIDGFIVTAYSNK